MDPDSKKWCEGLARDIQYVQDSLTDGKSGRKGLASLCCILQGLGDLHTLTLSAHLLIWLCLIHRLEEEKGPTILIRMLR